MKNIKYFIQFIVLLLFFGIFKLLGLKLSLLISGFIFKIIGPVFRSNKLSESNLSNAFNDIYQYEKKKIIQKMWENYGKIFAEYMFVKQFRNNFNYSNKIHIKNNEILEEIKQKKEHPFLVN